jgi:hypothetical protein
MPPMFWPLPASFLTGASAAAGIAAINSLRNPSGFAGPYAMGYLKNLTGSFTASLRLLAGCASSARSRHRTAAQQRCRRRPVSDHSEVSRKVSPRRDVAPPHPEEQRESDASRRMKVAS